MHFVLFAFFALLLDSVAAAAELGAEHACERVRSAVVAEGRRLGWHTDWQCSPSAVRMADVIPPASELRLADSTAWASGRLVAKFSWITDAGKGANRSLELPGVLQLTTTECVVRVAVRAGEAIKPDLVANGPYLWPVGIFPASGSKSCPSGRFRRSLAAGSRLTESLAVGSDVGLQGDPVTLILQRGAVSLQVQGRLLEDVRADGRVKVQPMGKGQVLEGIFVFARKTVEVQI